MMVYVSEWYLIQYKHIPHCQANVKAAHFYTAMD